MRKNKRVLVFVLGMVLLFSLAVILGGKFLLEAGVVPGGFAIESIDEIDVIKNNEVNPDGYFRIVVTVNRGSEGLEIGFVSDNSSIYSDNRLHRTVTLRVGN